MLDSDPEARQLTSSELERLREEIRASLDHARDDLERIEGLILIALFREARDAEGHNGLS